MHFTAHEEGSVEQAHIAIGVMFQEGRLDAVEGSLKGQTGTIPTS
jgi:hypothetical protein